MGSVKAVNLCSCCWEQGERLCSGLSLPSRRGRGHGQCPHTLPQIPFLQELQRESIYTHREGNGISEIYIWYVFIKVYLFRLKSGMFWALPFPPLQLLTFLSLLQPHFLLFSSCPRESMPCLERPLGRWWFSMTRSKTGAVRCWGPAPQLWGLAVVCGLQTPSCGL